MNGIIKTISYYRTDSPPVRFSYYNSFGEEKRKKIDEMVSKFNKNIEINCFCLMPNHFHLLVKQTKDRGISKFMANFQNSITKYRNKKYDREGHLFKGQFKAVHIEDTDQLLHIHRYIHLNPYASLIVGSIGELKDYPYSSLRQYLGLDKGFCESEIILSNYKNVENYERFVFDQADYQKRLKEVKHLVIEK